ncbi:DNA-directed RNA polymerase subunit alpha C-terminal domain-containing protein [Chitinophaga sp. HK235]|uniref:DNA-directed RNA polymerase subunit alpha C-terminal domain-containing protein n=1 Tax=Chitinophaga sp. HK235 TaxID=2952571 RepID=UPI001BA72F3E|nr:DNA-directed RNA polymerase subunit alpha C-terminal domain-containing protein [Chitinophaga sp. HK235]
MQKKSTLPAAGTLPKLASPALRALNNAGYTSLEQLSKVTESALLQLHGMGPNAITRIKEALQEQGLTLAKEK